MFGVHYLAGKLPGRLSSAVPDSAMVQFLSGRRQGGRHDKTGQGGRAKAGSARGSAREMPEGGRLG